MKKLLIALILLFTYQLEATCFPEPFADCKQDQLKIYWCSRLTKEAREFNVGLSKLFDDRFCLFLPQSIDLTGCSECEIDHLSYQEDIRALKKAQILLMMSPYGRDCAWEAGWASGSRLVTFLYVEKELGWFHDAMVKGGINYVITSNRGTHEILKNDPYLSEKLFFIDQSAALPDLIFHLYYQKLSQDQ